MKTEVNSSSEDEVEVEEQEEEEEEEEEEETQQDKAKTGKIPETEACNLDMFSIKHEPCSRSVMLSCAPK